MHLYFSFSKFLQTASLANFLCLAIFYHVLKDLVSYSQDLEYFSKFRFSLCFFYISLTAKYDLSMPYKAKQSVHHAHVRNMETLQKYKNIDILLTWPYHSKCNEYKSMLFSRTFFKIFIIWRIQCLSPVYNAPFFRQV